MRLAAAAVLVAILLVWIVGENTARRGRSAPPRHAMETGERRVDAPHPLAASEAPRSSGPAGELVVRGRIQVLGAAGTPLSGVHLHVLNAADGFESGVTLDGPTDATGWATWRAGTLSRDRLSVRVSIAPSARVPLSHPETVLRLDQFAPFELIYVDGRNGNVIAGGDARVPVVFHSREGIDATRLLLPLRPVRRGDRARLLLALTPPQGWAAIRAEGYDVVAHISGLAHKVRLRVPVWPELNWIIEARESIDGVRCTLANRACDSVRLERTADGRLRVRGVPAVPGAQIDLMGSGWGERGSVNVGGGYTSEPERAAQLGWEPRIVPPFPLRSQQNAHVPKLPLPEPRDGSTLLVRARQGDGTPAPYIAVRIDHGAVRWTGGLTGEFEQPGLSPRNYRVALFDPRWGTAEQSIELPSGRTGRLEFEQPPGRTFTIEVVDEAGRGVPAAIVSVSMSVARELRTPPFVDGVQELNVFTGPDGRFVWHDFPVGAPIITVRKGARFTSKGFSAKAPPHARIVLR